MTPLQIRRKEVCQAIGEQIATVGHRNWHVLQARFPGLPSATFWRYRREVVASLEDDESIKAAASADPHDQIDLDLAPDPVKQAKADERLFTPYGALASLFTIARG